MAAPTISRCPRCFADIGGEWQYCAQCGLPLDPAKSSDAAFTSKISYVEDAEPTTAKSNRRVRELLLRSLLSAAISVGIFAMLAFGLFVVDPDALSRLRPSAEPDVPGWARAKAANEPEAKRLGGLEGIEWSSPIEAGDFKKGDPASWSEATGYWGAGKIEAAFEISLYEITNKQFYEYTLGSGAEISDELAKRWTGGVRDHPQPSPEQEDLPVTGITYDEAVAFAAWLSTWDSKYEGARLPTLPEWEYAARGTDGRNYPWGNHWVPARANTREENRGGPVAGTVYGRPDGDCSFYGVFNMAGNVAEWILNDGTNLRYSVGGRWDADREAALTWRSPKENFTYGTDHAIGFRIARYAPNE